MKMNSRRGVISALVLSVKDENICYISCFRCRSKVFKQENETYLCVKCDCLYGQKGVGLRYRLCLSVGEGTSLCNITIFGSCLERYFGLEAEAFQRFIDQAQEQLTLPVVEQLLCSSLASCFVGKTYVFGVRTAALKQRPFSPLKLQTLVEQQQVNVKGQCTFGPSIVATQMLPVGTSQPTLLQLMCKQLEEYNSRAVSHASRNHPSKEEGAQTQIERQVQNGNALVQRAAVEYDQDSELYDNTPSLASIAHSYTEMASLKLTCESQSQSLGGQGPQASDRRVQQVSCSWENCDDWLSSQSDSTELLPKRPVLMMKQVCEEQLTNRGSKWNYSTTDSDDMVVHDGGSSKTQQPAWKGGQHVQSSRGQYTDGAHSPKLTRQPTVQNQVCEMSCDLCSQEPNRSEVDIELEQSLQMLSCQEQSWDDPGTENKLGEVEFVAPKVLQDFGNISTKGNITDLVEIEKPFPPNFHHDSYRMESKLQKVEAIANPSIPKALLNCDIIVDYGDELKKSTEWQSFPELRHNPVWSPGAEVERRNPKKTKVVANSPRPKAVPSSGNFSMSFKSPDHEGFSQFEDEVYSEELEAFLARLEQQHYAEAVSRQDENHHPTANSKVVGIVTNNSSSPLGGAKSLCITLELFSQSAADGTMETSSPFLPQSTSQQQHTLELFSPEPWVSSSGHSKLTEASVVNISGGGGIQDCSMTSVAGTPHLFSPSQRYFPSLGKKLHPCKESTPKYLDSSKILDQYDADDDYPKKRLIFNKM